MRITRRSLVGSAAALGALAAAGLDAAEPPPGRLRIVLAQLHWTGLESATALAAAVAATAARDADAVPVLFVLPPAGAAPAAAPPAADAYRRLAEVARRAGVFLAGAIRVRADAHGAAHTEGFLFGPDGAALLRAPKITPDSVAGFSDASAALDRAAPFPVAQLPFARVGLLVGEDIFRPAHVRALCFNGAEILLNCATEAADPGLPARRDAMNAVAYSHMAYVAVATGPEPSRTGLWDWTGSAVTADRAPCVSTLIDIDRLRVARHDGVQSSSYASRILPPMVRDGVYGPAFAAAAAAAARGTIARPVTRTGWAEEAQRRIAAQAVRRTPAEKMLRAYDAVLVQTPHKSLNAVPAPDRRAAVVQNIRDFLAMAEPYTRRPLTKLVMFGEFAFSGAGYRTIPDSLSVALSWPGPELDLIAGFAAAHGVYVACEAIELDPRFPGRVFNTAFVFDDRGGLATRHRKVQCVDLLGTFPDTTPGSIYDRYVAEYGAESLFQVVDTPLGRLAPMIAIENLFPEIAQLYAQGGAEVYLQLSSEGWDAITETRYAWNSARRQHALEASAYFLMVNQGDDPNLRDPYHVNGESQAIDPYGRVIGMLTESHPGVLVARVDLELLRTARSDPRANLGIWDEPGVYAAAYQRGLGVPNNLWANVPPEQFPYKDLAAYKDTVRRFDATGVFTPPRPGNIL